MLRIKILVTGGAGCIGSHWAVRWGPIEVGDIADRARLDEVIAKYQPVAVMHFAAYAYVGESVQDPGKYYRNNVAGTLTLLEAMRDNGIDKLIFSSTCATYGVPVNVPIREDHPQLPINPYGASKLMIERMLLDFDVAHGLRSISLRYFNAAGADPDGEIGEAHNPETHLIPLVLDAATGKRPAITVYGDDYETPDGTCIRDYIHVSDLAGAHLLALRALETGSKTTVYNLGNGQGFSVLEVIDSAARVTGRRVPFTVGPKRPGDPAALVGDASRAMQELGWRPQLHDIDSMIDTAWQWHSVHSANVVK